MDTFEELVSTIGVDVSTLHQPMTLQLMDTYCYSCDLKYIAVNTDNETLVSTYIGTSQASQIWVLSLRNPCMGGHQKLK